MNVPSGTGLPGLSRIKGRKTVVVVVVVVVLLIHFWTLTLTTSLNIGHNSHINET